MAQFAFENATLKLFYETGMDEQGKPILSSKSYQNIRETASANQIHAVVEAIGSLNHYPVLAAKVIKTDTIEL